MSKRLILTRPCSQRLPLTRFLVDIPDRRPDYAVMLNSENGISESAGEALALGTILILEDEILVSTVIEDLVRDMGASEVLVLADIVRALELVENSPPDLAILDVHLGGDTSFAVADALDARGIPFMFSSALGEGALGDRHRQRPVLAKPFGDEELRTQLRKLARP